jgi:hypothetical protein
MGAGKGMRELSSLSKHGKRWREKGGRGERERD